MYTSIEASSHYPNQDTQCDSIRSLIGKNPIRLELCKSSFRPVLCKECLQRRSHCQMLALGKEPAAARQTNVLGWCGILNYAK